MKVAITTGKPDWDQDVDVRFGRGSFIIIVDTDTMTFEASENPYATIRGGVSDHLSQFIVAKGVDLVLAGYLSPVDEQKLLAAGIKFLVVHNGPIRNAIKQFKESQLSAPIKKGRKSTRR